MDRGDGIACMLCEDECEGYDELEFISQNWHMCKRKGIIWQAEKEDKEGK